MSRRTKTPHTLDGLFKWLDRGDWEAELEEMLVQHIDRACEEMDLDSEGLASLLGAEHCAVLWGCAFEDLLTLRFADGSNIVDDYLKRRGWNESAANKAYMAGLRDSVMSLYEVSNIDPGRGMDVRDLFRGGDPVRVAEKRASRSLKQWDRIAVRVVPLKTGAVLSGGLLPYSYTMCETIRSIVGRAREGVAAEYAASRQDRGSEGKVGSDNSETEIPTDDQILQATCPFFTYVWLTETLNAILDPSPPLLVNSDGDEIIFTKVHYPLRPEVGGEDVCAVLDRIPVLFAAADDFWNWVEDSKTARQQPRAAIPDDAVRWDVETEDGGAVLGNVLLADGALTLSVNSPERAERGRRRLEPFLAHLILEPSVETLSVEEARAATGRPGSDTPASQIPPEIEETATRQRLDRHCKTVLDQPIPALNNLTPREAARGDDAAKAMAADWLKQMENTWLRQPDTSVPAYDFTWVWEELGLSDLLR